MALTVKDLLEAGCHFGHQTKRWNPKMKDYVYGSKNGISIIDITKTIYQIADACNFLQRTVVNGGKILFVGTKRQAQQIIREAAENTGMYYMMERWMGGTLTNNATIRKSIRKMQEIDATVGDENSTLKKKEIAVLSRMGEKLHRDLDGIADMKKLPDVVVIIDFTISPSLKVCQVWVGTWQGAGVSAKVLGDLFVPQVSSWRRRQSR